MKRDDILKAINSALQRKGLSHWEASRRAVGNQDLIRNMIRRKGIPSWEKLDALAKILELEIYIGPPRSILSADWSRFSLDRLLPRKGLARCSLEGWANIAATESSLPAPDALGEENAFYVRALGTSMQPEGIMHGDIILISQERPILVGDRVWLADQSGKASIKRLTYIDNDWIELRGWLLDEYDKQRIIYDRRNRATLSQCYPVIAVYRQAEHELEFIPDPKSPMSTDSMTAIMGTSQDNSIFSIGFQPQLLEKIGIHNTNNAELIHVPDDSMKPSLGLGDIALINKAQKNISKRQSYALMNKGQLMIRRVELVGNQMILHSDNIEYPTIVIDSPESDITILGSIVWSGRIWE